MQVIKIGAMWCPSCLIMNKVIREVFNDYPEIILKELDYDMDNGEVREYNVGKILPVLIFLSSDGIELGRIIGEKNSQELRKEVNHYAENN